MTLNAELSSPRADVRVLAKKKAAMIESLRADLVPDKWERKREAQRMRNVE